MQIRSRFIYAPNVLTAQYTGATSITTTTIASTTKIQSTTEALSTNSTSYLLSILTSTTLPQSAEQSSISITTDANSAATGSVTNGEVSILFVTSIFTSDLAASKAGSSTLPPTSISSSSDTPNQSQTGITNSASNTTQTTQQPVSSTTAIAGIAVGGTIALRHQVESATNEKSRKTPHKSNWDKYRKSEFATDTEIKEMGDGLPRKNELEACGNEIRELKGDEAAQEVIAGQPRLICGSRELEGTPVSMELPS
ncbi:hypothetical protein MMC27_001196 [Xylographa pallens]|nr:hypothetical protein [Xylographa pallens]